MTALLVAVAATGACGKKSQDTKQDQPATAGKAAESPSPSPEPTAPPAKAPSGAEPGIEAGPIQRDDKEGAAAVITAATGTVELRRVGATEYEPAAAKASLYPGDQLRTGEKATATVALADQSVVEVAEVSTIGIGTREGSADPASSAAVLSGLARFTVTARAPGEGAFKVYTPTGVAIARGTVFAIGVSVSGQARLGVESGQVDFVGLAAPTVEPVVVQSGFVATTNVGGGIEPAVAWTADDWGTWRTEADGKVQLGVAVEAHGAAMADLAGALQAAYADLEAAAAAMAELEAKAAAAAEAKAVAQYEVVAPEAAATIDASFGVGAHAEALTWAYAGHATLAYDVYVRNPDALKAQWQIVAPRVEASVLWPKRFVVTSAAYLEPLRVQYYIHHPRGRLHASLVGVAVPEFYAQVTVPEPQPPQIRAKVKTVAWIAPQVVVKAQARPIWIAAPEANWHASLKIKVAPPRAKVAWYVRPPEIKTKVLLGADAVAVWKPTLVVAPPAPRASFYANLNIKPVGTLIAIRPPDLAAAAKARMSVKVGADGRMVIPTVQAGMKGKAGLDVKGPDVDIKGKAKVVVPAPNIDVKVKAPKVDVKGKLDAAAGAGAKVKGDLDAAGAAGAKAGAGVKAGVQGGADVKAGVKVKAPPPPKVEAKGKVDVKGGFKIGN